MKSKRIDQIIVDLGLAKSRSHAQKKIELGCVFVRMDGHLHHVAKASETFHEPFAVEVRKSTIDQYVSRGGLKLEGACEHLQLKVRGFDCLDVGASTGGFTDYLLQKGAASVLCLDAGMGQLESSVQKDSRVRSFEKVNCRYPDQLELSVGQGRFDLIVMDVSFISATLIFPNLKKYLKNKGGLLSLVKPQFELGPEALNRSGLVKEVSQYPQVEKKIKENLHNSGFEVLDYFQSTELGGDGNVEFFVFAK